MPTPETAEVPTAAAIRARRYRSRKRNGVRCILIRVSEPAIAALVEGGFLAQRQA
jgi:hypothetical protein